MVNLKEAAHLIADNEQQEVLEMVRATNSLQIHAPGDLLHPTRPQIPVCTI